MLDWPIFIDTHFLPLAALLIFLFAATKRLSQGNVRAVALDNSRHAGFEPDFIIFFSIVRQLIFSLLSALTGLAGGIDYAMGVDGISVLFVILTTSLMPICILASWEAVTHRVREYMVAFPHS